MLLLVCGCATRTVQDAQIDPYRPRVASVTVPAAAAHSEDEPAAAAASETTAVADPADSAQPPSGERDDAGAVAAAPDDEAAVEPVEATAPVADPPDEENGDPQAAAAEADRGSTTRDLKSGDDVRVYLLGIPKQQELEDIVDEDGSITLPFLGPVKVDGMTTSQAEEIIERLYVERQYFSKIDVVIVAETDEYFVQGEVRQPGRYPLRGDLTLLQAIVPAGGYTDYAKKKAVRIIRGDTVTEYDMRKIEAREIAAPLIEPGDVIDVPRRLW